MKIAFDVDVLAKQSMDINWMVHQVADWGYKYIEQSPHPRINPFYKHPLFSNGRRDIVIHRCIPLVRTDRRAAAVCGSQLETYDRDRGRYGGICYQYGVIRRSESAGNLQWHVVQIYGRTASDY